MKVLVTGGAGAVGTTVVKGLAATGFEVTVFDRVAPVPADVLGAGVFPVASIIGDVGDLTSVLAAVRGMDAVIHLTNAPGGQWESNLQTNLVGTYNIFEASAQAGVQLAAAVKPFSPRPPAHFYGESLRKHTERCTNDSTVDD
jgi:nucleoside-diphosphate-sugar epimerase